MDVSNSARRAPVYRDCPRPAQSTSPPVERRVPETSAPSSGAAISIAAKTIAGVGIGFLVVISGAALIGVAAETILIPSLLAKLAGGIAGGGVGMAKGMQDAKKP